ncbi:MAG: hypothetical protein A2X61_16390 [Ignavibacteria bacterium GWB2_35_12]|nr:MAG: hypothetical protein A2X61_16390 [Ignavibacteria bacterium GWB2_35_12]OGV23584.1 MAG: hypothetical protein A2475_07705 [Ignavibacteria bacterium RIFOXYC2_FULL_35_21]
MRTIVLNIIERSFYLSLDNTLKNKSFMNDIKPISVNVLEDGEYIQKDRGDNLCVPWDPRINIDLLPEGLEVIQPYFIGKPRSNYISYDLVIEQGQEKSEKFTLDNNIYRKNGDCNIDILAPARTFTLELDGYYTFNLGSVSYAIPHVAATAALMLSVDSVMNAEKDDNNQVIDRADIPRKVYDIITFTADKIPVTTLWDDVYDVYVTQEYTRQVDNGVLIDPLDRWWSGNTGYGAINAYRCVAHSIRNKANAVYTSGTLNFITGEGNVNEDGKKLMHMGARNEENELVLEHGGDKYTGEADYNNCHGTTKLNGNNLALEVPTDCILAIDGILKQDQETKQSNKIYTSGNGKILMTGYLNNVELNGLLKTSNLKIFSANDEGYGKFISNAPTGEVTEIYDSLIINDNSIIDFYSGDATLMPGGVIYLKGDNDLVIEDGATLTLDYSSKIAHSPNNPRKIIIKPGGTLIVKEGAIADINCKLIAESNINEPEKHSQFIVEPNVLLRLKEFDFGKGSLFKVQGGSWVSLTEHKVNPFKGDFEIVGNENNSATISGDVCYCGEDGNKIKVINSARIRVQGYPNDPQNSGHLQLINAVIDNVSISARKVLIQNIDKCKFYADIDIFDYGYLLSANNTVRGINDLTSNIVITDCEFKDIKMGIRNGKKDTEYEIYGLIISGFGLVNISGCSFSGLEYSADIEECLKSEISTSTFSNCKIGTFNNHSELNLHNNTFNYLYWGSAYINANLGFIYNNTYNRNCIANVSWESNRQFLCNNDYNEFVRGILSMNSIYDLGPWHYYNDENEYVSIWHGGNYFEFDNNPFPEDFHFRLLDGEYIDIEWSGVSNYDWIWVLKGKNKFSINSDYHLSSLMNGIYVQGNEWRPYVAESSDCVVRHNEYVYLNWNNDLCNSNRDNICGDVISGVPDMIDTCLGIYGYLINGHYVWNVGQWTDTTFSFEEWQSIITQAIDYLQDSLYYCKCKFQIYNDLLAAIQHAHDDSDSTYQKLNTLIQEIKDWCNDYKLIHWFNMAYLYEYFNQIDSARAIYVDIVTNYSSHTIDSIVANWRLLYLDAITQDSTFEDLYDSLLNVYHERIIQDMRRFPCLVTCIDSLGDTIHYRRTDVPFDLSQDFSLGQNIPNPFSDETEIQFYLKNPAFIKLAVYDAFGREIAVLVNEYRQPGKHSAIYRSPNLYNGVYFYRLEAGGIIETRKMQLIR